MQSNTQAAQLHAGRHTHRNILCAAHPDTHVQSHTFHPGRQVPHLPKVTHGQSCPSAQTNAREGRTPPGSARGPTHTPPESRPHSEPATRVRSPSPAPIHPATSSEGLRRLHPPSLVGSGQILLGLWPTRDPSFREGRDVLVTHVRAATTADRDQSQAGADCACAPRGGPAGLLKTTTPRRCCAWVTETTIPRGPCVWSSGAHGSPPPPKRAGRPGQDSGVSALIPAHQGRGALWRAGPVLGRDSSSGIVKAKESEDPRGWHVPQATQLRKGGSCGFQPTVGREAVEGVSQGFDLIPVKAKKTTDPLTWADDRDGERAHRISCWPAIF